MNAMNAIDAIDAIDTIDTIDTNNATIKRTVSDAVAPTAPEHLAMWHPICRADRLEPGRGIAALVSGHEVAIFLLPDGTLAAIDNVDPICGVGVLSRGIIGDVSGRMKVASPMYKHAFCLRSGSCLDDERYSVRVHHARIRDGFLEVCLT